jgi:hypothetical protein
VACAPTEFEKAQAPIIKEMKWLYTANPDKDFEKAVKIGDFRFIGIYGYRLAVPGVDIKCLDVRKDVNPIKGTTDAVLGYEHSKLIAIAGAYANYYNFRMRIYLEENNGFECGP